MREGNSFTLCVSVHTSTGEGGVPTFPGGYYLTGMYYTGNFDLIGVWPGQAVVVSFELVNC